MKTQENWYKPTVEEQKNILMALLESSEGYCRAHELYDAATCDKEKLLIEDGEHAGSDLADFNAYWDNIKNFLHEYMEKESR